jgi:hypothetical protein
MTVVLAAGTLALAPVAAPATELSCSGDGVTPQPISIPVLLNGSTAFSDGTTVSDPGFFVAPQEPVRGLVIFSHGHQASPYQWFQNMARVAQNDHVIAVAMYYPGETILNGGTSTFGWRVREGAQAGIAAAEAFLTACPKLEHKTIVDYGTSMGGNTSGLMAAAGAKRPNGRPLFDYWFDIEGDTNANETYLEASATALSGNKLGKDAQAEIEQENGGTPAQQPQAYADFAVITHAEQIADSGIKGVVLVHGLADGEVPYDMSVEMQARLAQVGVPTAFYSVLTKTPGTDCSTTIESDVLDALPVHPIPCQDDPMAGHGGEGSQNQLVIQTGFGAFDALFNQHRVPSGHQAFLVDGTTGQTIPRPNSSSQGTTAPRR